ncbi:MAG: hypothetical protein AMJ94_12055 [Deltaproteobacteria bacterium SM23_61]|nr:MAG: hypothetical protein AMJ94_12055 [Deltaproteobacteria bacterium SM23_61]
MDDPCDHETLKVLLVDTILQKDGNIYIYKIENSDIVFHLDIKQTGITCIIYDLSLSGSFFRKDKEEQISYYQRLISQVSFHASRIMDSLEIPNGNDFDINRDIVFEIVYDMGKSAVLICKVGKGKIEWGI